MSRWLNQLYHTVLRPFLHTTGAVALCWRISLGRISRPFLDNDIITPVYTIVAEIPPLIRSRVIFLNQIAAFPRLICSMYRLKQINALTEEVEFRILLGLKTEGNL